MHGGVSQKIICPETPPRLLMSCRYTGLKIYLNYILHSSMGKSFARCNHLARAIQFFRLNRYTEINLIDIIDESIFHSIKFSLDTQYFLHVRCTIPHCFHSTSSVTKTAICFFFFFWDFKLFWGKRNYQRELDCSMNRIVYVFLEMSKTVCERASHFVTDSLFRILLSACAIPSVHILQPFYLIG